ncbi:MAG: class I SAM-dependent methyltransferase [Armatimonadota bacterium]
MLAPTTRAALDRLELPSGAVCLDLGCGGGDVTLEIGRRVGPRGTVLGADLDEEKLELARSDAEQAGVENVEFRRLDARESLDESAFDLVYCRFILSHLPHPEDCVQRLHAALKPGGTLLVEDVDFSGHFSYPDCPALRRYVALYSESVRRRGGDPDLGPRLPVILAEAGFEGIQVDVVQPTALQGEAKWVTPITMESLGETPVRDGLATAAEIEELVRELWGFAENPRTISGVARIVQAWGTRAE